METHTAITALLIVSMTLLGQGHTFPDSFERSKWLDTLKESYLLRWSVSPDDEEVYFRVEVSTRGYVGFGLSHHGSMSQADIVIGGVYPDGSTYFSDRHGPVSSNGYPPEDDHQDWWLEYASENETHTILGFWRKMKTCDPEDIDMTLQGTMILIYAWSEDDPEDGVPQYHGAKNRGGNNMHLTVTNTNPDVFDSAKYFDLRLNITIPDVETSILCKVFRGPDIDVKHHIIGVSTLPATEHPGVVHHGLLFQCHFPPLLADQFLTSDSVQFHSAIVFCNTLTGAYTPNREGYSLPSNVGYPLNAGEESYYLLQAHYYNPLLKSGASNFGFRLFYTDNLRPNDATTMLAGHLDLYGRNLLIPPGQKDWVISGHCHHQCTEKAFREPVKIYGVTLHAHLLARTIRLRHFRNGTELPWIANDEHYDFYSQEFVLLPSEVEVMPGDHLTAECFMDSTAKNVSVFTGQDTDDEMCAVYIGYYPAQAMTLCTSTVNHDDMLNILGNYLKMDSNLPGSSKENHVSEHLATIDSQNWEGQDMGTLRNLIRYGSQRPLCMANSLLPFIPVTDESTGYPEVTEEFTPPDTCTLTSSSITMHPANIMSMFFTLFVLIIVSQTIF